MPSVQSWSVVHSSDLVKILWNISTIMLAVHKYSVLGIDSWNSILVYRHRQNVFNLYKTYILSGSLGYR